MRIRNPTTIGDWSEAHSVSSGRLCPVSLLGALLVGWLALFSAPMSAGAQGAVSSPPPTFATQQVTPPVSREPLTNPGMGLYLFGTLDLPDVPPDAWFTSLIPIGYFREDWAVLEPDAEGVYQFDSYFKPIFDLWVNRLHKRVAFRFMAENMHSRRKYVTPKWVFDKGVPFVRLKGIYAPEQIDPVFWDERYLKIQERFIADLGHYLDGRPGLEFIDIGSIGEWGEMHLARWTPEQLQQTGFTKARYIAAYRRLIDAFARAFPHTRVFLNVGDYETINDYAALRGLHFRQDGLNPSGPSADVGKRFYRPYSRRGVICNYELYAGYDGMKQRGWGVKETFDKGLEDPISYLHVNLMGFRDLLKAPDEVKEAITDAARRIGFRFMLTHLRCNRTVGLNGTVPGRVLLEQTWQNTGVAPCYRSYALRWTLTNTQGQAVAEQVIYPAHPTTLWWPGETVTCTDVFSIPADTPPGSYRLKVAMFEPEDPSARIQLGMEGRDSQGRYDLCPLPVERRPGGSDTVYQEGFEAGVGGWEATEGIQVHADANAHSGKQSLGIRGLQPGNAWSYAALTLKTPVLPASRYELSGWMRVDHLSPGAAAPYLKIGLNDANGKWLTNVETNKYDMSRPGTWQRLIAYVETTPETAGGQLAVEKGSLEGHNEVTLELDDVRLELLESP